MARFALCLLAALPSLANANATYSDAASPWEAVIMLSMAKESAQVQLVECSAKLPRLAAGFQEQLASWKEDAATALAAADARADSMVGADAERMAGMRELARTATEKVVAGAFAAGMGEEYCVKEFEYLASGVWRQRTPRLYAYLEDPSAMP